MSTDKTQPHEREDDTNPDASPKHTLVEVEPGVVAVFGPNALDGLDLTVPPMLPKQAVADLTTAVAKLSGVGNVVTQVAASQANLQGLVRLAPETIKAMQTAQTMTSGGYNLGTLVDSGGKFAHSVRWVPADGVAALGTLSTIGPAVAMMAIQMQLAQMQKLLEENLKVTKDLFQEVRIDRWAKTTGLARAIAQAIEEARHVGAVPDGVWANVAASESELQEARERARRNVENHIRNIEAATEHHQRRDFLQQHSEAVLEDIAALVSAQHAWFGYQGLRAAHLYQTDRDANETLIERISTHAKSQRAKDVDCTENLLGRVHELLSGMGIYSGRMAVTPTDRRARRTVDDASRVLLERLEQLEQAFGYAPPRAPEPRIKLLGDKPGRSVHESLRWVLDKDDELLTLLEVRSRGKYSGDRYIAVTRDCIRVAEPGRIVQHGGPWLEITASDVRFVKQDGDNVDIYTPHTDLHLDVSDVSRKKTTAAELRKTVELLKSFANLPADEVPANPFAPTENTVTQIEEAQHGRED